MSVDLENLRDDYVPESVDVPTFDHDDFANCNSGDRLEVLVRRRWELATVVERVYLGGGDYSVYFTLDRRSKNGRKINVRKDAHYQVRWPVNYSPLTANVYADWLDDRGEHSAAAKLRQAFPISPKE